MVNKMMLIANIWGPDEEHLATLLVDLPRIGETIYLEVNERINSFKILDITHEYFHQQREDKLHNNNPVGGRTGYIRYGVHVKKVVI